MQTNTKKLIYISFSIICILYVLCAQIRTAKYGRADNGDFYRSSLSYAAMPVGFPTNWPLRAKTPDLWADRFYKFYLPLWEIQTDKSVHALFKHSVHLLWTPGFYLNKAFFSSSILDLRFISLLPRLMMLAALLAIMGVLYRKKTRLAASMFLVACLVLTFSDTYYLSYLNSFYQETGALAALAPMLPGLLLLIHGSYYGSLGLIMGSLMLYGTAKSQYAAASFCLGMVILAAYSMKFLWDQPLPRKWARTVLVGLCLVGLLGSSVFSVMAYEKFNAHRVAGHRYFGALSFSEDPVGHLVRAGFMPDAKSYIGQFDVPNVPFPLSGFIGVIVHEPTVLLKFFRQAATEMQDVQLKYLGIVSKSGRTAGDEKPGFALWTTMKILYFPREVTLLVINASILLASVAGLCRAADKRWRRMFFVVLLLNLGVWGEMGASLGDGTIELPKHLFAANLFFDFQVAMGGFVLLQAGDLWRGRGGARRGAPPAEEIPRFRASLEP